MLTLTFYHPRFPLLKSVSTPDRYAAGILRMALMVGGYKVRVWRGGALATV